MLTNMQLRTWQQNILFGTGTNVIRDRLDTASFGAKGSHNTYANLLAATGLVGMTTLLLSQTWFILRGWKRRILPQEHSLGMGLTVTALSVVVAYVCSALASDMRGSLYINTLLWLSLALFVAPVSAMVKQEAEVAVQEGTQ